MEMRMKMKMKIKIKIKKEEKEKGTNSKVLCQVDALFLLFEGQDRVCGPFKDSKECKDTTVKTKKR